MNKIFHKCLLGFHGSAVCKTFRCGCNAVQDFPVSTNGTNRPTGSTPYDGELGTKTHRYTYTRYDETGLFRRRTI